MEAITLNEVLKHVPENLVPWQLESITLYVLVFIVLLTFLMHEIGSKVSNRWSLFDTINITIMIVAFLFLAILAYRFVDRYWENDEMDREWTENYVIPYIDSLPVGKTEIINGMEIISETKAKVKFNVNGEIIYYESPKKMFKPMELSFTLGSEEKPYIEYVHLDEPIEWHESGYYNLVLYLPEDYQFEKGS